MVEKYISVLSRNEPSSREDAGESREDDTRDRAVPMVACRPRRGLSRSALAGWKNSSRRGERMEMGMEMAIEGMSNVSDVDVEVRRGWS